mmetsp:Transcript_7977/g.29506  ORF Transcript_7977/g.29506 Transcript_7977/m.29506 type:complete len:97 (+) Transcript_7977:565-855(+)
MCERHMPLTKHHLYPKATHAALKQRGLTQVQLSSMLWVCRQCHNAIHKHIPDNRLLAENYNSLEKLLEHAELYKFARWASSQKGRSKRDGTLAYAR